MSYYRPIRKRTLYSLTYFRKIRLFSRSRRKCPKISDINQDYYIFNIKELSDIEYEDIPYTNPSFRSTVHKQSMFDLSYIVLKLYDRSKYNNFKKIRPISDYKDILY